MANWRRTPRQMQAATHSVAVAPSPAAPAATPAKPAKSPRARMMRQYDLVERVRSYNPDTNEDLLNRAYVYAMKAHGAQTRASGDPYFSYPIADLPPAPAFHRSLDLPRQPVFYGE